MIKRPAHHSDEFNRDREFSVILERIHSDVKIIAEDVGSVKKRVDVIYDELGRQREDISFIKTDIREIKLILKSHDKRLTFLEAAATK